MPASLKDLRNRIKSIKNTQQMTKAMKLVSASKFGRAQHAVIDSREYAKGMKKVFNKLLNQVEGLDSLHPLLSVPTVRRAVVVAFSSERGLCGAYNANITKNTMKAVADLEGQGYEVNVVCIGKKSFQSLQRRRNVFSKSENPNSNIFSLSELEMNPEMILTTNLMLLTDSFEKASFSQISHFNHIMTKLYVSEKISKVVIVYNKFQSALTQIPSTSTLLPLVSETLNESKKMDFEEPIYEPNENEFIAEFLNKYTSSCLFSAQLDAIASEHGARMTAMDNATRNAKEMERKLQITYQRARQAAITKELIEIISGAEAL